MGRKGGWIAINNGGFSVAVILAPAGVLLELIPELLNGWLFRILKDPQWLRDPFDSLIVFDFLPLLPCIHSTRATRSALHRFVILHILNCYYHCHYYSVANLIASRFSGFSKVLESYRGFLSHWGFLDSQISSTGANSFLQGRPWLATGEKEKQLLLVIQKNTRPSATNRLQPIESTVIAFGPTRAPKGSFQSFRFFPSFIYHHVLDRS